MYFFFQSGQLLLQLLALLLMLPAAGLMVRLFILQHDCGHGALFSNKKINDWAGRALGIITLTPYEYWREMHAAHHACSGNLDKRGIGDIDTLTVQEYHQKSTWGKIAYRLYRHPVVMFGLGPAYLFILRHRIPVGRFNAGLKPWASVLFTNLGIVVFSALMIMLVGWKMYLLIQIPVVAMGASIGVWMFYIQHQFEDTHWDYNSDWAREHAALHGSSYYDLPGPLMWLTGNIGIHHVHHLSSRIPFHKLPKVVEDHPELKEIGRLTFFQSLKTVRLTLWDEHRKQMISFKEFNSLPAQSLR